MTKVNDYINKAKETVKTVNKQAKTQLNLIFKVNKMDNKVRISVFVD